jgi:Protein of unknown function, DUF481
MIWKDRVGWGTKPAFIDGDIAAMMRRLLSPTVGWLRVFYSVLWLAAASGCGVVAAQKTPAPNPAPDLLILSDGDTLHGKLVMETTGKVTFHTESLGDVTLGWDKIKELHTGQSFAVLSSTTKLRGRKKISQVPVGTVEMTHQTVTVQPVSGTGPAPIPTKDAQYIIGSAALNQQVFHEPNFFTGWNGVATAGATIVSATENQYTASGSVNLVREVPSVTWLDRRNQTSAGFSGSFGKITESGVPAQKTAILHADAERDEYVSSRLFALAQTTFDHNFSQGLALQSVYGGGLGWTAIKDAKQHLDLKATIQYESQQFLSTPGSVPTPNQNLIGSTFSATYALHLKLLTLTQNLAYMPAYNTPRAYSASETDSVAFPAYKNFSFTVGTLDSYLNDPPLTTPPTKPNSFQFTMGVSYAIKSKY